MPAGTDPPDFGERKLRDWMLCLLRFAITQTSGDQVEALALASELDTHGDSGGLTYFQRTSVEVCRAIVVRDENGMRILRQFISRIEEPRLRSAFSAAVGLDAGSKNEAREFRRTSLWRGLP
jgi:hypothetical protein